MYMLRNRYTLIINSSILQNDLQQFMHHEKKNVAIYIVLVQGTEFPVFSVPRQMKIKMQNFLIFSF